MLRNINDLAGCREAVLKFQRSIGGERISGKLNKSIVFRIAFLQ
jgi:hypothetical protein